MKLAAWARQQGIDYKTAYRWFRAGILPVTSRQLPTGTILVDSDAPKSGGSALYARVSCSDQHGDLDRQLARLVEYAAAHNIKVTEVVKEIGSGLNGKRPKLLKILARPDISGVVVEHRDRLARFGSEYIEAAMLSAGKQLVVVDRTERTDDLEADMIDVLTSMCARLYGRRSARNRAKKALEAAAS